MTEPPHINDPEGKLRAGMTIRVGMPLAFALVVAMTMIVGLVAWLRYAELADALELIAEDAVPLVMTTRDLSLASRGLSAHMTEMTLAADEIELDRRATFARLATERLATALLDAERLLPERQKLATLQQVQRQITDKLVVTEETVRERLRLSQQARTAHASFQTAYSEVVRALTEVLQVKQGAGTSAEGFLRSSQYRWRDRYYWELLSLIRNAEPLPFGVEDRSMKEIAQKRLEFVQLLKRYRQLAERLRESEIWSDLVRFDEQLTALTVGSTDLFRLQQNLLRAKRKQEALLGSSKQLDGQFTLLTSSMDDNANRRVQNARQAAIEKIDRARLLIGLLVVSSLGLSVLLAWLFGSRRLVLPLLSLVSTVKKIEAGDLAARAPVAGAGEIQQLARVFNRMTETIGMRDNELRQLHNLLRNVIDSLTPILIAIDQDCRLTLWNMQAEKLCDKSALTNGQPLDEALRWLPLEFDAIRRAVSEQRSLLVKQLHVRREGVLRTFELSCHPLIETLKPGAVLRIEDVTERLRIERTIAQSEKMMSVGGLAAGIAHEINNPLAGILQSAQVLSNRLDLTRAKNIAIARENDIDIETIERYLQQRGARTMLDGIRDSANKAAQIVKNMLAFSRTGEGIEERHFELLNLGELVDNTVELLAADYHIGQGFDFRQIRIKRHFAEPIPLVVCEGALIQQVIFNILKNAAQALNGARGELGDPCIELTLATKGQMLELIIADNGPGMPESVRQRIFEPFYTTKATDKGTGLGMSVSYFIVTEYHQGTIEVESEPKHGTRFIICLPQREQDALESSKP